MSAHIYRGGIIRKGLFYCVVLITSAQSLVAVHWRRVGLQRREECDYVYVVRKGAI